MEMKLTTTLLACTLFSSSILASSPVSMTLSNNTGLPLNNIDIVADQYESPSITQCIELDQPIQLPVANGKTIKITGQLNDDCQSWDMTIVASTTTPYQPSQSPITPSATIKIFNLGLADTSHNVFGYGAGYIDVKVTEESKHQYTINLNNDTESAKTRALGVLEFDLVNTTKSALNIIPGYHYGSFGGFSVIDNYLIQPGETSHVEFYRLSPDDYSDAIWLLTYDENGNEPVMGRVVSIELPKITQPYNIVAFPVDESQPHLTLDLADQDWTGTGKKNLQVFVSE